MKQKKFMLKDSFYEVIDIGSEKKSRAEEKNWSFGIDPEAARRKKFKPKVRHSGVRNRIWRTWREIYDQKLNTELQWQLEVRDDCIARTNNLLEEERKKKDNTSTAREPHIIHSKTEEVGKSENQLTAAEV